MPYYIQCVPIMTFKSAYTSSPIVTVVGAIMLAQIHSLNGPSVKKAMVILVFAFLIKIPVISTT